MGFLNNLVKYSLNSKLNNIVEKEVYTEDTFIDIIYDKIIDNNIKIRTMLNEVYNKNINIDSEIDFQNIIKSELDNFIADNVELLNKYIDINNTDSSLNGIRKALEEYKGKTNCIQYRFSYKNLDISKSYTTFQKEIDSVINKLVSELKEVYKMNNNQSLIASKKQELLLRNSNREEYLNSLRGRVINKKESVIESNFANELYNYFRTTIENDNNSMIEDNVSTSRIREAIEEYYNIFNKQKIVIRDYNIILKYYKSISLNDKLESIKFSELNEESRLLVKSITMDSCFKIQSICNIYRMVIASKYDAISEYNKLNKDICLSVLRKLETEEE